VLVVDGPARPWSSPFAGTPAVSASLVMSGVSIAVLSFLGFDAIASFAEETTGESRDVGRAIFVCLAVAGAAFVAQTYVAALLSPVAPADLAADPGRQGTAFYDVTRAAIGAWLAAVLAVTKAVGPAFAAMTGQAAAARLVLGMAREGRLPATLARVDRTRGVPRTALLATAALTLAVSVWAARRADGLAVLVSVVDVGALGAFTLLHASVVGYFVLRRRAPSRAAHVAVPVVGAAVTVWVLVATSGGALVTGALWLGLGAVVFLVRGGAGRAR
jgi:amino acid transporter